VCNICNINGAAASTAQAGKDVTMPTNNLNRDQIWTSAVWQDIDNAVLATPVLLELRKKVLSTTPVAGESNVPPDVFHPDTMSIEEGQTKSLIEISVEFRLRQSQVDNESTLHTTRTLAKLAAKSLVLAEDILIFQSAKAEIPKGVKVISGEAAEKGLLGVKLCRSVVPASKRTCGISKEKTRRTDIREVFAQNRFIDFHASADRKSTNDAGCRIFFGISALLLTHTGKVPSFRAPKALHLGKV